MSVPSWDNCPTEILCQIFRELEVTALLICMQVCSKWKDVVYYIAVHYYGGLENVLSKKIEDGGMIYRRKSNINFSYSLSSLLWYNICNAKIHCARQVCDTQIRHLSIYKDNVIVVNDDGVTYFDVDKWHVRQHFNFECDRFEESDYMIVIQKGIIETDKISIKMYAKRSIVDFTFTNNPCFPTRVNNYKFHEDRCYVIDNFGKISIVSCDRKHFRLHVKYITRYYGSMTNVAAMHVTCNLDVYIILRTGDILRYDTKNKGPLMSYLYCDLSHLIFTFPVGTFHRLGAVFKTPSNSNFDVKYYDEMDFMLIQCPGLTCVTDHGSMLLIGNNNGEVKIFIKSKLMKGNHVPERTINVGEYLSTMSPCEIRVIEVHEKLSSHILFIATDSVIVKLCIHNPEVINCVTDCDNIDETCLSIIHLLNIDE